MFPPSPQCSVPARYARLHYALGGGGKETKPTTNILLKVPNLFQDLTLVSWKGLGFLWPRGWLRMATVWTVALFLFGHGHSLGAPLIIDDFAYTNSAAARQAWVVVSAPAVNM